MTDQLEEEVYGAAKIEGGVEFAILEVYRRVGYVQKHGARGGGVPYTFASESALLAAIRPEMVAAGLTMRVHHIHDVRHETVQTTTGKDVNRVTLSATIRFAHPRSETSVDVESVGEGADSADKATAKALTSAYKYALRETFAIETGDDPDDQHQAATPPKSPPRATRTNEKRGAPPKTTDEAATAARAIRKAEERGVFYAELKARGVAASDTMLVHALVDADCGARPHIKGRADGCHALREIVEAKIKSGASEADAWSGLTAQLKLMTDDSISKIKSRIRPDA